MDSLVGQTITLRIPNRFYADWISTHYLDLLLDSLTREAGVRELEVDWLVRATHGNRATLEQVILVPGGAR